MGKRPERTPHQRRYTHGQQPMNKCSKSCVIRELPVVIRRRLSEWPSRGALGTLHPGRARRQEPRCWERKRVRPLWKTTSLVVSYKTTCSDPVTQQLLFLLCRQDCCLAFWWPESGAGAGAGAVGLPRQVQAWPPCPQPAVLPPPPRHRPSSVAAPALPSGRQGQEDGRQQPSTVVLPGALGLCTPLFVFH